MKSEMLYQGNTEGSNTFSLNCSEDYYIMGLWLADGYWRTGSIGLSSTNQELLDRFSTFLNRVCPFHPLKIRLYPVKEGEKRKQLAKHVYVSCRWLTRLFLSLKIGRLNVPNRFIIPYLSGRIDGDGHVDHKHRSGIRIAYGSKFDAERDKNLLLAYRRESVSLYRYERAGTWVIYLKKKFLERILPELRLYSLKCCPVETESKVSKT